MRQHAANPLAENVNAMLYHLCSGLSDVSFASLARSSSTRASSFFIRVSTFRIAIECWMIWAERGYEPIREADPLDFYT